MAVLLGTTLSVGATGSGTHAEIASVSISGCDVSNACMDFSADIATDADGTRFGQLAVTWHDASFSNFVFVACSGPAYAEAADVNRGSGIAIVSATLDPLAADCQSFSSTGTAATVTVSVAGQPDGQQHDSTTGVTISETLQFGTRFKSKTNLQKDCYTEIYSGTITPFSPFGLIGFACKTDAVQH
jgi:hypothetical protein